MMASLVLDSIRSALHALERLRHQDGYIWKDKPKNLEIFVLCARKLGNDAQLRFDDKVTTLGSLLQRIHDAVSRFPPDLLDEEIANDFHWYNTLSDFEEEIGHWYNTVSDWQLTFHEGTEIIDTVSEGLDFIIYLPREYPVTEIEAMAEKLTFLRNFIRFATLEGVEPRVQENLMVHIQAVSVNAAQFYYKFIKNELDKEDTLVLVQKIHNLIDPGGYEMYTQALITSKSSTLPHSRKPGEDHGPLVTMKDFVDSLRLELWKRLQMDTCFAIFTRVQLQLLYEGLRLLRCI